MSPGERKIRRLTAAITWLPTANWDDEDLTARGRLPAVLRERRICLLGAGALGAQVAELLVRGGVRDLVVIDPDRLQAGNLARHTLLLTQLEQPKADALAERLNAISPHARVRAVCASFPALSADAQNLVRACDLIIDCTADDAVLTHLSQEVAASAHRLFVSFSLGYQAERLFCFAAAGATFPLTAFRFREFIDPWLRNERDNTHDVPWPCDGIGCWHPLFPARADDVTMMATCALKELVQVASQHLAAPSFVVYAQHYEDGVYHGVRRLAGEDARG